MSFNNLLKLLSANAVLNMTKISILSILPSSENSQKPLNYYNLKETRCLPKHHKYTHHSPLGQSKVVFTLILYRVKVLCQDKLSYILVFYHVIPEFMIIIECKL